MNHRAHHTLKLPNWTAAEPLVVLRCVRDVDFRLSVMSAPKAECAQLIASAAAWAARTGATPAVPVPASSRVCPTCPAGTPPYPLTAEHWRRSAESSDGFGPQCKACHARPSRRLRYAARSTAPDVVLESLGIARGSVWAWRGIEVRVSHGVVSPTRIATRDVSPGMRGHRIRLLWPQDFTQHATPITREAAE